MSTVEHMVHLWLSQLEQSLLSPSIETMLKYLDSTTLASMSDLILRNWITEKCNREWQHTSC
jgi:hypothetical protein